MKDLINEIRTTYNELQAEADDAVYQYEQQKQTELCKALSKKVHVFRMRLERKLNSMFKHNKTAVLLQSYGDGEVSRILVYSGVENFKFSENHGLSEIDKAVVALTVKHQCTGSFDCCLYDTEFDIHVSAKRGERGAVFLFGNRCYEWHYYDNPLASVFLHSSQTSGFWEVFSLDSDQTAILMAYLKSITSDSNDGWYGAVAYLNKECGCSYMTEAPVIDCDKLIEMEG